MKIIHNTMVIAGKTIGQRNRTYVVFTSGILEIWFWFYMEFCIKNPSRILMLLAENTLHCDISELLYKVHRTMGDQDRWPYTRLGSSRSGKFYRHLTEDI